MSTKKIFIYIIALALFIIPFFWLKPGEINLGGDSSRAYLYQPLLFIKNYAAYGLNPWNIGGAMDPYFIIPFSLFLNFILEVVRTPYNLNNVFNSLTLVLSFLATYACVYLLIIDSDEGKNKNYGFARTAAIIGAFFYIFSPNMTNWDKSLLTFNQIFLDPLLFFLIFKYIHTRKIIYGFISILITFIFAPNFSFVGAPSFFSFYPFVFCYLAVTYFRKKTLFNFKQIALLIFFFIILHSFQFIPQFFSFTNSSSAIAERTFSQAKFNYVEYFYRIAEGVNVSNNFLNISEHGPLTITLLIFPLLIVLALFIKVKDPESIVYRKQFLVFLSFFLVLLFFTSAKFTGVGLTFYANLFKIPGFGMFRHFTGQFITSFSFFYAVTVGFALYSIYKNINRKLSIGITLILFVILLVQGWPLINGRMLYLPVLETKISTPFIMSPSFEKTLDAISKIKTDAKILSLPLNDFGYLMVSGEKGGLYIGTSLVGPLTLKQDFQNSDAMGPFGNKFLFALRQKDSSTIKNMFAYLNIQDILWNKDPFIYEGNFSSFPYGTTKSYIATNIPSYTNFLSSLPIASTTTFGNYYELMYIDKSAVLPKIYTSNNPIYIKELSDTMYINPFSENKLNVVLTSDKYTPDILASSFQANYIDEFSGLNDNLQFHSAVPEVSWKPGSILYPFALWKEDRSLRYLTTQADKNTAYLYLAKRVEELNKWGKDMPVLQKDISLNRPKLTEVTRFNEYNSWEASYAQYKQIANLVIHEINSSSSSDVVSQKIIAFEQFEQHRMRIQNIINASSFSQTQKDYLLKKEDELFDAIEKSINLSEINIFDKKYTLTIPKSEEGDYLVHLSRLGNGNYSNITIQNNIYSKIDQINNIISFGTATLPSQQQILITLHTNINNLSNETTWENGGSIKDINGTNILTINTNNNSSYGIRKKLELLPNSSKYIVSFSYKTNNQKFLAKLYGNQLLDQGKVNTQFYSSRVLNSEDWKLYQTVIAVDPRKENLYFEILNNSEGAKDISIKDFGVYPIENPILTFSKVKHEEISLPTIIFQRINPTKYKVNVANATSPYILTFLQAFDKNWNIYLAKAANGIKLPIDESYLNGKINEGGHTNIFIDRDTFETWGKTPIAESTHTIGDGYANSWVIKPSDVGNSSNYELIIELKSEKYFYLGSLITVIALSILCLVTILSLIKLLHRRKYSSRM